MERYLSEWLHVRRGGTWHFSRLRCAGQNYSPVFSNSAGSKAESSLNYTFYQPCYMLPKFAVPHRQVESDGIKAFRHRDNHPNWAHVPLDIFVDCPYNLAHNRQVRMLADLTRLGCYRNLVNWSVPTEETKHQSLISIQRDLRISAKHTLLTEIRVFGLIEHIVYTQYMMQRSLNIVFRQLLTKTSNVPLQSDHKTHAMLIRSALNASQLRAIENRIQLDTELYRFARALFTRRLCLYLISDSSIPFSFRRTVRTLLSHRPSLWAGLEYLLLGDRSNSQPPFAQRLEDVLIRGFMRRGSVPVISFDVDSIKNRWATKLASDFRNAGLLTAVTGSLIRDYKTIQVEEEEEERED